MRARSRARAWALLVLYGWDTRGAREDLHDVLGRFARERRIRDEPFAYLERLIDTLALHHTEIDRALVEAVTNWRLDRLAVIDRNILRIGAAELLHHADVPPRAAIQEALLLAEKYGSVESPRFVNGVLDALMHRAARDGRGAAGTGEVH